MPKHCEAALYPEDGWDVVKIEENIQNHKTVVKYVIALHDKDVQEDGTPLKPHYHVYINCGKSNVQLGHVAKWFNVKETAVEKIKSDSRDRNQTMGMYYTVKYYTHKDQPEKHYYPPNGFTANFDVEKFLADTEEKIKNRGRKQANREQVKEICDRCADGTITPDNFHDYVPPSLYVTIKPRMERAWQYYEQDFQRAAQGMRDCTTIYVYGKSGTGKSLLCRLYAQELGLTCYTTAYGQHPFDEYQDEEAVIIDDIRPYMPFSHVQLLNLTDPHYLVKAQARYKNKLLKNSFMFITSVLSPQELWAGFHLDRADDRDRSDNAKVVDSPDSSTQLFRRLSEIWEVTETWFC